MDLSPMEKLALRGLIAREQAIAREWIAPLQADYADWRAEVEHRLDVHEGAIGTTHRVDGETGTITDQRVTATPTNGVAEMQEVTA